ncbi:MAG: hypothetical protein ACE15C_10970 [Phycisphaerae bacterium]
MNCPVVSAALVFGVALCSIGAAAATPTVSQTTQPAGELRTEHYDLQVQCLDASEVGRMLEQLHAQLSEYFGAAPSGRLSFAVYASRDEWASALRAEGQYVPPNAGGYYSPQLRKVYAWIQPSAYFTRQVLLHEATHQFHWLTATGNSTPTSDWYAEGLAEYFGMHDWDGGHLRTGVIPAVTLEDYPAAALKAFEAAGEDVRKMSSGAGRPAAWAIVHFLRNKHPDQFRQLSARLDRQEDAAGAWDKVLKGDLSRLSQEFGSWLKSHVQPWQIVWANWQQRGDAIEGDSQTMSLAVLKATPKTLAYRIEPQTAGVTTGLVFGYRSPKDFYVFQALGAHSVRIIHRKDGTWTAEGLGKPTAVDDCTVLSITQDDKSTTLWAGGKQVARIAAVGQVGLNVENGRALFRPI